MIELELPWPPSVNHYKEMGRLIQTKSGKLYQARINSDATNMFYHAAWVIICQAKARKTVNFDRRSTIDLEVIVTLHPPDKRRRDIDNGIKLILDSLQRGGLIADDNQVCRLLIERKGIVANGKVIVRVSEYAH